MTGAQFEIRIDGTPPVTATERTMRWRPRGSSKARIRTAWSRSKTCEVETLPRWLLGQGERCPSKKTCRETSHDRG